LAVNSLLFVGASLARPSSTNEEAAAAACAAPGVAVGGVATPASVGELRARVVASLGEATADRTMAVALREADVAEDERRPLPLRRLAERVEAELSAWVGPLAARRVLGGDEDVGVGRALEQALAAPTRTPEGEVRRWLLALLEELPMGVCAVDAAGEIVVWNRDLAELTGVDSAIGARFDALPAPFAELFTELRDLPEDVLHERHAKGRVLRLRRATLPEVGGEVLLVEDLTERRELRAQVAHQDRLASLGRLAAGVAHELGNPLAGLLMVAKGLAREPHADDAAERLGLVVGEAERLDGLLRTLLGFARRGGTDGAIVAHELLADAARIAQLGRDGKHVRWTVEATEGLALRGDRTRLTQVLVNLLVNAADASPDGEEVIARASREDDVVRIEILDRGEGIDPTVRERIFEPFVTTKAPGEGTGLGLAVSYGIVQDHGGTLSFAAREGGGTVFRVEVRAVE
ncbi:MAG: histidine kinase, partial [Myxococcales bacterium]|nr:histidine kinase [Myxococcales bacterium]